MSAYEQVYSALKADAELIALVPASRIQRHYIRDGVELPAISYRRVGTEYLETVHDEPPLAVRVQFALVCVAMTEESAESVGNAIESVDGLRILTREDDFDVDAQVYATVVTVEVVTQIT